MLNDKNDDKDAVAHKLALEVNRALVARNTTKLFEKLGDFMQHVGMVALRTDLRSIPVAK